LFSTQESSISTSLSLSTCQRKKAEQGPTKTQNHVFPKQAQRDGLDETVNPLFPQFSSKFQSFSNCLFSPSLSDSGSFLFPRMMSDYKVEMINDGMQEFYVQFHGPNNSEFAFLPLLSFLLWCFSSS